MVTEIPEGPDAGLTLVTTGAVGAVGGCGLFPGGGVVPGLGMGDGPTVMMDGVVVVVWPLPFFVVVGGVTSTPWVPVVLPGTFPLASGK
jgi:hypothetical protein